MPTVVLALRMPCYAILWLAGVFPIPGRKGRETMKVAETFEVMQTRFRPSAAAGLSITFQWNISGREAGVWAFKINFPTFFH